MSVYQNSRYIKTGAYRTSDTNAMLLKLRTRPSFDIDLATYYTWVQGDTIDGVAYRQYDNAQLWWAIMDANPKYASEMDILPGDVLTIPSYKEVVKLLV